MSHKRSAAESGHSQITDLNDVIGNAGPIYLNTLSLREAAIGLKATERELKATLQYSKSPTLSLASLL